MTDRLPLFPLAAVLCPGSALPVHVFEPRYRALLADLEALPPNVPRRFGVVAIRAGFEVGAAPAALFDVGCAARPAKLTRRPDGSADLVAHGTGRFRIGAVEPTAGGYLRATIGWLPDPVGAGADELVARATAAYRAYRRQRAAIRGRPAVAGALPDDPVRLSYALTAKVVMPLPRRQALLELPDAASRLAAVLTVLREELAIMTAFPSLPDTHRARWSPN